MDSYPFIPSQLVLRVCAITRITVCQFSHSIKNTICGSKCGLQIYDGDGIHICETRVDYCPLPMFMTPDNCLAGTNTGLLHFHVIVAYDELHW